MMSFIISIVAVIAVLAVHFFVSVEFYKAAAMKGWPQKKYFYMALGLWIVGYMLIIALPDRGGSGVRAVEISDLPEL